MECTSNNSYHRRWIFAVLHTIIPFCFWRLTIFLVIVRNSSFDLEKKKRVTFFIFRINLLPIKSPPQPWLTQQNVISSKGFLITFALSFRNIPLDWPYDKRIVVIRYFCTHLSSIFESIFWFNNFIYEPLFIKPLTEILDMDWILF